MKTPHTTLRWRDKWRYHFDNLMSARTSLSIVALGLLSLAIIFTAGVMIVFLRLPQSDGTSFSFIEAVWESMLRTLDAGTMSSDTGWPLRLIMLAVTLGGIFVVSAFIGIIVSGMEKKLEELGKGRSLVLEKNHTVILGWSPKIFTILSELIEANKNKKNSYVAILAERDKAEMEDEIRARIPSFYNTKIICRSGKPTDLFDIHIVNINVAHSIIILPGTNDHSDIGVIKSMLAITKNPHRKKGLYNIIGELREGKNKRAAKFIAPNESTTLVSPKIISEITVQTCLQPGLSVVYTEFLDFAGSEIYFGLEPKLVGKTFGQALLMYDKCCLIGLRRKQDESITIKPPFDTVIQEGDEIIAVAEDDDTLILSPEKLIIDSQFFQTELESHNNSLENVLMLGWNSRSASIITALDKLLKTESLVHVVGDTTEINWEIDQLKPHLKNIRVTCETMDLTDYILLESIPLEQFHHVMLVAPEIAWDEEEKDARTLITLIYIRTLAEQKKHSINIVTEMLDVRNMELAQITKVDDFIVSDRLISLMLAQLSENGALKRVFDELFGTENVRIHLKPAHNYVLPGVPVNFATVTASVMQKNGIAIGYRLNQEATISEKTYGIYINPDKTKKIVFSDEDSIIVID